MNLESLAKLAGVSPSTVSKVFSDSKEVSQKTKEQVIKIAKEHGCFEKYNKNRFPKRVIGVICPEINGDYYNATVTYLNNLIQEQGDIMTLSVSDFSRDKASEIYEYFTNYIKTDAVILLDSRASFTNEDLVPTVVISGGTKATQGFSLISSNMENAIKDAVTHLVKGGCKTIGFAGEQLTVSRKNKLKAELVKQGVAVDERFFVNAPHRFEKAGVYAVEKWIKQGIMPDAIVGAYDFIAIGCIKALKENGYRVPEDVAVIGMDDVARAEYLETPLSSIHYSMRTACRLAIDMINEKLKNKYYMSGSVTILDAGFVPRKSSQKPLK